MANVFDSGGMRPGTSADIYNDGNIDIAAVCSSTDQISLTFEFVDGVNNNFFNYSLTDDRTGSTSQGTIVNEASEQTVTLLSPNSDQWNGQLDARGGTGTLDIVTLFADGSITNQGGGCDVGGDVAVGS